jgi:hypothetical protein
VTLTGNCILEGTGKFPSYSIYYGSDYSGGAGRSMSIGKIYEVSNATDVSNLPTSFPLETYRDIFHKTFRNTKVRVHSILNLVYLIRLALPNFASDKKTVGRSHIKLY